MKSYPIDKYHFYTSKNKVIAVSTYAGRPVRGIAKCNPNDVFDLEKGKALAAARCNERVARKRELNAKRKYVKAVENRAKAQKLFSDASLFKADAMMAREEAEKTVKEILETM